MENNLRAVLSNITIQLQAEISPRNYKLFNISEFKTNDPILNTKQNFQTFLQSVEDKDFSNEKMYSKRFTESTQLPIKST